MLLINPLGSSGKNQNWSKFRKWGQYFFYSILLGKTFPNLISPFISPHFSDVLQQKLAKKPQMQIKFNPKTGTPLFPVEFLKRDFVFCIIYLKRAILYCKFNFI